MKLILDSCVSRGARDRLRLAGHDVEWIGDWSADPGDVEILKHAATSLRVLVTIDKDFGELAIVHGHAHCGMIRLSGFRAAQQGDALVELLRTYERELLQHAILSAEPWRVRVRHIAGDNSSSE